MRIAIAIAIVLAATLSVAQAATPSAVRADVDPQILDGTEQLRLDRARERWRRFDVSDYRFRVALRCFCPPDFTAPRVIVVRNGRPRSAPKHLRQAATVRRLQRIVQRAITNRVSGLNVRYGRHGVPRSIGLDPNQFVADDEHQYEVDRFRPSR